MDEIISAVNQDPGAGGALVPDQVYASNSTRLVEGYFQEALTTYATGWRDPNDLESQVEFLTPSVQVGRRFEYSVAVNAEEFYSDDDDRRNIGASFKMVEYTRSKSTSATENKGLTMRVDLDNVGDEPMWRENRTARLLQRCQRNELRRSVYALSAAATDTSKTWDTTALKDPDQDVLTELVTGLAASGVRNNRIVYNDTAWSKRILAHRAQNTAGGFASAGLNEASLASFFGVEGVKIIRSVYQDTPTTKAAALIKSTGSGNIVLIFYGASNMGTSDPSHAKRFWTPTMSGGKYRVYEQQITSKLVDITIEYYSKIATTSAVSGSIRQLTIS